MRALPEQQLINAIIGNVKLSGAVLLKIEQKSKTDKKVKRKKLKKMNDTKCLQLIFI